MIRFGAVRCGRNAPVIDAKPFTHARTSCHMRLVPTAVAVLILLSGCADPPPAAADVGDCKEGASEFFLVLVGNNDCECDRYDTKFTVVERNGDVFQYVGQT